MKTFLSELVVLKKSYEAGLFILNTGDESSWSISPSGEQGEASYFWTHIEKGNISNPLGPAEIVITGDFKIVKIVFLFNSLYHRTDGPSLIRFIEPIDIEEIEPYLSPLFLVEPNRDTSREERNIENYAFHLKGQAVTREIIRAEILKKEISSKLKIL